MKTVSEYLQEKGLAPIVIDRLASTFTTRQFIWKLAKEYEVDYVTMLVDAFNVSKGKEEKPRIFHNLHAQIGRYLLNHAKELGIEKIGDDKEPDINPFGRATPTQKWQKIVIE